MLFSLVRRSSNKAGLTEYHPVEFVRSCSLDALIHAKRVRLMEPADAWLPGLPMTQRPNSLPCLDCSQLCAAVTTLPSLPLTTAAPSLSERSSDQAECRSSTVVVFLVYLARLWIYPESCRKSLRAARIRLPTGSKYLIARRSATWHICRFFPSYCEYRELNFSPSSSCTLPTPIDNKENKGRLPNRQDRVSSVSYRV